MKTKIILVHRDQTETAAYAIGPAKWITLTVVHEGRLYTINGFKDGVMKYTEVLVDNMTVVFTDEDFDKLRKTGGLT